MHIDGAYPASKASNAPSTYTRTVRPGLSSLASAASSTPLARNAFRAYVRTSSGVRLAVMNWALASALGSGSVGSGSAGPGRDASEPDRPDAETTS
jgi:hypothetical protein